MKPVTLGLFAVVLALGSAPHAGSEQSTTSTGIPECDRYASMVTACLQKMCETDRVLVELELSFRGEALAKLIELKGREAAAKSCAQDTQKALQDDEYGCYVANSAQGAAPTSTIRGLQVMPSATSVRMTFGGDESAAGAKAEVSIASSFIEPPTATYRVAPMKGEYVLDTASSAPDGRAAGPPIRLEPATTYCYVISSPEDSQGNSVIWRKGIFTTRSKRSK